MVVARWVIKDILKFIEILSFTGTQKLTVASLIVPVEGFITVYLDIKYSRHFEFYKGGGHKAY